VDFIEPCFGIGHNLSLICQMTSEDIKHQLIIITTVKQLKTMKYENRSKITYYLFWLNYVVFYPVLGRIWRDDDV